MYHNDKKLSFHDSKLLERIYGQWLSGDWKNLVDSVIEEDVSQHADEPEIALFMSVALLQLGKASEARQLLKARKLPSTMDAFRALVGSIHNTLGRANALSGNLGEARSHFSKGLGFTRPGCDIPHISRMREMEQFRQLGVPIALNSELDSCSMKPLPLGIQALEQAQQLSPQEPSILIALAESAQRREEYDTAVRYWQELAALLQESMPQIYYDRLDEAYQLQKSFPLGTPEEEKLFGEGDKHELLKEFHRILKPKKYLEVGVQTGKSFLLAACDAIGIDPMPRPNIKLRDNHMLLRMTSDKFFSLHADYYLSEPPDLVFIDGMHLFEFALRDFINVERYSSKNTVVVIDDIFPGHPAQAERDRRTRAWTGDVWKLADILEQYRPDLTIHRVDVFPTGLMVITELDSRNTVLPSSYEAIAAQYGNKIMGPTEHDKYNARSGSVSQVEIFPLLFKRASADPATIS
ncbi:class I SAM-dependent methyltransferase [Halomonas ramblicola]|uniref:class I SAM-dependent methyltransferase n=1 Tax=Halomonas ramblicola TaxID=747349 RepID=UPI0025B3E888|nr:class I SAM-dependent methyltransferase [Halomonas ramblicola]MDN3522090.1 class I SAM-dependent methyltransferase [Halomonas ramblicola]